MYVLKLRTSPEKRAYPIPARHSPPRTRFQTPAYAGLLVFVDVNSISVRLECLLFKLHCFRCFNVCCSHYVDYVIFNVCCSHDNDSVLFFPKYASCSHHFVSVFFLSSSHYLSPVFSLFVAHITLFPFALGGAWVCVCVSLKQGCAPARAARGGVLMSVELGGPAGRQLAVLHGSKGLAA